MKNKKTLKIGRSDFKLIVGEGHYFVDKTMLIYDFYYNANDIMLIPRPRRFGKTLNLSMIENFFDIQKPESKELFSEFEIYNNKEFCELHQNKYPVINITLKDVKETNWDKCLEAFKYIVAELYEKNDFLLKSDKLSDNDKLNFTKILDETTIETKLKWSLKNLSEYLFKHFGQKAIILVDEYDAPIINAFNHTNKPIKSEDNENKTYYEKVISFMQVFLGKAYKGNDYLKKGLLTGILRVGKESIFSEWNNFDVFGVTSSYFSEKFGFTENEIKEILTYFDLQSQEKNVKKWYDGYRIGNIDNIYNPWSIVNYISKTKDGFKPYWVNSGDYSLIKERINEVDVNNGIQKLLEGNIIEKEIYENFVFQDFEYDNELIWSLLTDNGYLTQIGEGKYGNYKLRIPNYEIKIVFKEIIRKWIKNELKITKNQLISTCENLINNNITEFEEDLRQILGDTLSYYDTNGQNATPEQIYHVYVLGLLTILSDDYIIKSNRESGEGRYDIMMIPYDKAQNGLVIELKSIDKQQNNETDEDFKSRINNEIDNAIKQIENKEYYKELLEHKIQLNKILRIPIIFAGKKAYVKKLS